MSAVDIEDRITDVVRALEAEGKLGERFSATEDKLCFGPKGSLSIVISGPERGSWYDREQQRSGGPYDLIWEIGGHPKGDAFDNWVRDKLGVRRETRAQGKIRDAEDRKERALQDLRDALARNDKPAIKDASIRKDQAVQDVINWGYRREAEQHEAEQSYLQIGSNGHDEQPPAADDRQEREAQDRDDANQREEQQRDKRRREAEHHWGGNGHDKPPNGTSNGHAGNGHAGNGHDDGWDDEPQWQQEPPGSEKIDGNTYGGHYYARTGDGRFVDEDGQTLDIAKLFPPPPRGENEPLVCKPLAPLPITEIPPRPWAYGHFLIFGQAAVLGAVDGGGKGAHAVAIALSMITGQALLGERVWRTGPVAVITYEDDEIEWRRRIASACLEYGIDYDQVCGSFHFITRPRGRIKLAALSAPGRPTVIFPDGDAIVAELKRIGAALLIVDPFNHAHTLDDGNSNAIVAQLASEITRIAAESQAAALVLHHLRKGNVGSSDDLMGAVMLRATFRAARVLVRMTEKEAATLNIPAKEAFRYSRIAGTKENYAPPPDRATWYKFESHNLGNGAGIYSDGDDVHVVTRWQPADPFKGLQKEQIAEIFEQLRAGPGDGEFYSPHATGKTKQRWAGNVIVAVTGKSEGDATRMISAWLDTTLDTAALFADEYESPRQRKSIKRVIVNEAKAREWLGPLYRPAGKPAPGKRHEDEAPPAAAPKNGHDKHDVLDRIFAEIERGVPGGNGVVRYYSLDAASEHPAYRIIMTHLRDLNSNEAQAMVEKWVGEGIFMLTEEGVRLSPLTKQLRGIE